MSTASTADGDVVDTHVHIWDPRRREYPWLQHSPDLQRPMLPDAVDRADGRVTRMVFVEAGCVPTAALDEIDWVIGSGATWPELAAIVAAVDLTDPDLRSRLAVLAARPLVRGVRHTLQGKPAATLDDGRLRTGLIALHRHGLVFDACVDPEQLDALAGLLERVTDTVVVLDHLGKPPLAAGLSSAAGREWAAAISRLARRQTTVVKLSGMSALVEDRRVFDRHAPDFIRFAVDAFGSTRTVFGSDWPLIARRGFGLPTTDWLDVVVAAAAPTSTERADLLRRSAERVYRPAVVASGESAGPAR